MVWEALVWLDHALHVLGWLVAAAGAVFVVLGLAHGARVEDLDA